MSAPFSEDTGAFGALDDLSIRRMLDEEEHHLDEGVPRLATGFKRLDQKLGGGFPIPSLVTLGAPPKSLKSTFAQVFVTNAIVNGGALVLFVDMENGRRGLLRRIACRRAGLAPSQVKAALEGQKADRAAGVLTPREEVERWTEAKAWVRDVLGPRLFVMNRSPSPAELKHYVTELRKRAGPDTPVVVVLDSLQKLDGDLSDRRAMVDEWTRKLEPLRDDFNLVILEISEITSNYRGEYGTNETALKESRGIAYAADIVMIMARTGADDEASSTLRVSVARDSEEDARGPVATYRPLHPFYGVEELDPVPMKKQKKGPSAVKANAARVWLKVFLTERGGGPVKKDDILEAGEKLGHLKSTLDRAADELNVNKDRGRGWRLP
jgi:replicative DNA helicase